MKNLLSFLLFLVLLGTCSGRTERGLTTGDTIHFRYARLLTVVQNGNEVEITVRNPWQRSSANFPDTSILRRIRLQIPVRNAGVYSIVHAALMRELNSVDAVGGICDVQYLTDSLILAGVHNGSIVDMGSSMQPSIEHIIKLGPDVLLSSPYEGQQMNDKLELNYNYNQVPVSPYCFTSRII